MFNAWYRAETVAVKYRGSPTSGSMALQHLAIRAFCEKAESNGSHRDQGRLFIPVFLTSCHASRAQPDRKAL
jgi:hypothetical protein